MGKVKEALIQDMMLNPDKYNHYEDYEFWMQCRAEELLEREKKVIYEFIFISICKQSGQERSSFCACFFSFCIID